MYRVAVFGPTTLAGQEFLDLLAERPFPITELHLLADDLTTGQRVAFRDRALPVEAANTRSFQQIDLAFFFGGASASARFAPLAAKSGAFTIDTTGAFRADTTIPCIVPALNGDELSARQRLVSTPTPATLPLAITLQALEQAVGLRRVSIATYHAVSDLGQTAIEELNSQVRLVQARRAVIPHQFPHQLAFNVLPEVDVFLDNGSTREEALIATGIQRLLRKPGFPVSITATMVPVYIGHSAAVHVELEEYLRPEEAREIFAATPGVKVRDEPSVSMYPYPWEVAHCDDIFVGRVRSDLGVTNGLAYWVAVDNLRRGTALAALDIAFAAMSGRFVRSLHALVPPPN